MNTKVSAKALTRFLVVAVLIVGTAFLVVYYRNNNDNIVLYPPLRGFVKTGDDFPNVSDLYSVISSMKGFDVDYKDFLDILERWAKTQGVEVVRYGQLNTVDFPGLIFKNAGFQGETRVYSSTSMLKIVVFGKWISDRLHLIAIFKYSSPPDMDDAPDYMGFRWWDSFFALDKATGYVHMKYVMGTASIPQSFFNQPIPSVGLPATAYYTKFYERFLKRKNIWWGNYLVNTDLWYADWGVLYVVLSPIDEFECSSIAFDFIHSFMSSGLDIDFHQVLGQVDIVLNPPRGSTLFYVPLKICRNR